MKETDMIRFTNSHQITGSVTTGFLINIGEATLTTVVPVKVIGHEGASATLSIGALLP